MRKPVAAILFVLFSLLSITGVKSQDFPSEMWHEGKLVTVDEDTLKGELKYDLQGDVVQVNTGKVLKTFHSRKVLYFEIFDKTVDGYRFFYSLPYGLQSSYEVPVLFEVLFEGKLTLLCREQIVTENATSQYGGAYSQPTLSYSRTRLAYTYYFLNHTGDINIYNLKKRELLDFFGKYSHQVSQYMKKNSLKHDRMRDLVRITAYYNALL